MILRELFYCIFFTGLWAVSCQDLSHCDQGPCGKGQFFSPNDSGSDQCKPCQAGTYMNQSDHACAECYKCQRADERLYQIASIECTPKADSVITCQKGYYRASVSDDSGLCYPCSECGDGQRKVQPCEPYEDTQCTSIQNMTGENTSELAQDGHEEQRVKWKGQENSNNQEEEGLHPALRIFLCLVMYATAFVIMFLYLWFMFRYVLSTTRTEPVQQSQELEKINPERDDEVAEIE